MGSYLVEERYSFVCWGRELALSSVHVTEVTDWLILHDAQVVHGATEGDLHSFTNAGCASFHHFDLVDGLVYPQRNHLGSRKPLPVGSKAMLALYHLNDG